MTATRGFNGERGIAELGATASKEICSVKRRLQRTATPENRGVRCPELPYGGRCGARGTVLVDSAKKPASHRG
jgi:hypothetical protein